LSYEVDLRHTASVIKAEFCVYLQEMLTAVSSEVDRKQLAHEKNGREYASSREPHFLKEIMGFLV